MRAHALPVALSLPRSQHALSLALRAAAILPALCAPLASAQWSDSYSLTRIDAEFWRGGAGSPNSSLPRYSYGTIADNGWIYGHDYLGMDGSPIEQVAFLHRPGRGTIVLGLFDPEHTSPAGEVWSQANLYYGEKFLGYSNRYFNGLPAGTTAWMWDESHGYTRIGLTDAEHTSPDGARTSFATGFASPTLLFGTSSRSGSGGGSTAFAYDIDTGAYTRLGLVDALHTRADGFQFSQPAKADGAGGVFGISFGFAGATQQPSCWWWSQATGTLPIGLLDSEHLSADGLPSTSFFNSQYVQYHFPPSQFGGHSVRYAGTTSAGQSAWWFSPQHGTTQLGYRDAAHTSPAGVRVSQLISADTSGRCAGNSVQYFRVFDSNQGQTSWTWTYESGHTRIGLTDAFHTHSTTGRQHSEVAGQALTPAGSLIAGTSWILGYSSAYASAWIWTLQSGTVEIGLRDSSHTDNHGNHLDAIRFVDPSGRVYGTSSFFSGNHQQATGSTVWMWSASTGTVNIGPSGPGFISSDGKMSSFVTEISAAGQILGSASWYGPRGDQQGSVPFFFDPDSMTTVPLIFETSTSGRAGGNGSFTRSGSVIGAYQTYSGDTPLEHKDFIWTPLWHQATLADLTTTTLEDLGMNISYGFMNDFNQLYMTINATAGSTPTTAPDNAVFLLSRIPACTTDRNSDGGIDGADVQVFFDSWQAGDPIADVNFDGGIDGEDVATFFTLWEQGSC